MVLISCSRLPTSRTLGWAAGLKCLEKCFVICCYLNHRWRPTRPVWSMVSTGTLTLPDSSNDWTPRDWWDPPKPCVQPRDHQGCLTSKKVLNYFQTYQELLQAVSLQAFFFFSMGTYWPVTELVFIVLDSTFGSTVLGWPWRQVSEAEGSHIWFWEAGTATSGTIYRNHN